MKYITPEHQSSEKYLEYEKKIQSIVDRENTNKEKEKQLKERSMELKAREISLDDKAKTVKRVFDKINQ